MITYSSNIEVFVAILLLAVLGGELVINPIMCCLRGSVPGSHDSNYNNPQYTKYSHILGMLERALYLFAWVLGYPNFIVVWLGFKVASKWKLWAGEYGKEEEKGNFDGRARFQIFLIGNAMTLLWTIFSVVFILSILKTPIKDFSLFN